MSSAGFSQLPSTIQFGALSAVPIIASCGAIPSSADGLVAFVGLRDSDPFSVSQFDVGGQPATILSASASPVGGTNQIQAYVWNASAVSAMASTGIAYTDSGFLSPAFITYAWLRNADVENVKIYSQGTASPANDASISVSVGPGELLIAVANNSDDPNVIEWDGSDFTITEHASADNAASLNISIAYASSENSGAVRASTSSNANFQIMGLVFPVASAGVALVANDIQAQSELTTPTLQLVGASAPNLDISVTGKSVTSYTVNASAAPGTCDIYMVAVYCGSSAPTAAQIIAGLDGASASAPSAVTSTVIATSTDVFVGQAAGVLSLPIYDIYAVAVNGIGTSSVESALNEVMFASSEVTHTVVDLVHITGATQTDPVKISTSAPHGFSNGQQARIWTVNGMTALNSAEDTTADPDDGFLYYSTSASTSTVLILKGIDGTGFSAYTNGGFITPGWSLLENASSVADGDVMVVDASTSAGDYPVTVAGDGTFIISASGDTGRQSFNAAIYNCPQSSVTPAVTIWVNNQAPALTSGPIPSQEWQVSVSITPLSAPAYIGDAEGDVITWAMTSAPAGISIDASSGVITGAPQVTGAADATILATDITGDVGEVTYSYTVLGGFLMPSVDDGTVTEASAVEAITSPADPGYNITVTVIYTDSGSANPGFVHAQDPAAGTLLSADAVTTIFVVGPFTSLIPPIPVISKMSGYTGKDVSFVGADPTSIGKSVQFTRS